jgi:RNA polymerase sigma-70 factor, ECF subfamily
MSSSINAEHEFLSRWVQEHGSALRGFIRSMVRCSTTADDLVQETFRKAWQARHNYTESGQARSYLLRIADRLTVDYLRQRREQMLPELQWKVVEPHTEQEHPAQQLIQVEMQAELQQALNALSEIQRRVLLLRYYGDMDFNTIANQLELPLNTVLSHCHRGLQQLRKTFRE